MIQFYIVLATIVFGFALRSCRTVFLRKTGAAVILLSSGLCFYFLTDSILAGIVATASWFFLPWVELLTKIRKMRVPLDNKLQEQFSTNLTAYPSAEEHLNVLEDSGYEHIRDCGWDLAGMKQVYQLFWNAETKSVAALCLCEQSNVTFTYLTLTSHDTSNGIWRTTNFPFSPTLKPAPKVHWHQISCSKECAKHLIQSHQTYISKQGFVDDDLRIPDPDQVSEEIERELRHQIEHNLSHGIIQQTDDGHFRYTIRGLFFLWKQFIRDMIRLC